MAKVAYVHNAVLHRLLADAEPVHVGTPDWFNWLDCNTSFGFADADGHFTARKEQAQQKDIYWKAYRKRGGKLFSTYLGRSQDLTLERLHMAARALAPEKDLSVANGRSRTMGAGKGDGNAQPETLPRMKFLVPYASARRVHRPRLLERLRDDSQPLTLIVAPSGYGKTALVADWISADQHKAAWVSLDAGDSDPTRFWSAVAWALDTLWRGVGRRTLALLQLAQPMSLAAILPTLLKDVATHVVASGHGYPAALVFDDYDVVTNSAIHDSVVSFIERLPPELRIVILSRTEPSLPLSSLRDRGRLAELRLSDLAFTKDEMAQFGRDVLGLSDVDDEFIEMLAARTEGWAAGLHFAAMLLRGDRHPSESTSAIGHNESHAFNDLIEEALSQQPAHVQQFLLATAILDRLRAELCDEIVGGVGSQAMLAQLAGSSLFLIGGDDEGPWFRRHPMVTNVLLRQLRTVSPNLEPEFRRRASAWFEREGFLVEAIDQALAGQDWVRATDMLERTVNAFWERGEGATVRRWLGALPETIVKSRPRLGLMRALLLLETSRLQEASDLLDAVERALAIEEEHTRGGVSSLQPPTIANRARASVLRAHVALLSSSAESSLERKSEHARNFVRQTLAQALIDLPYDDYIWRAAGSALLGESSYRDDDLVQADRAFADAAASARSGHAYGMALGSLGLRAETLMAYGRLTEAHILCEETSRLALEWSLEAVPAYGDVVLAMIHYERNELARAEQVILREIEQMEQIGLTGLRFRALLMLCRLRLARGDASSALQVLKRLEAGLGSHVTLYGAAISAWRARIRAMLANTSNPNREQTQLDRAAVQLWAEEATAQIDPSTHPLTHATYRPNLTMLARAHLLKGDAESALSLLQTLRPRAEAAGARDMLIELLALEAMTLDRLAKRTAAFEVLCQALTLGEPEGYMRMFVDEGLPMAHLLQALLAQRDRRFAKTKDYARRLLGAIRQDGGPHL